MRCKDGTIVLKSAEELMELLVDIEEYFNLEITEVETKEVDEAFFSSENEETPDPLTPVLDRYSWEDVQRQAGAMSTLVGSLRYHLDRIVQMEHEKYTPPPEKRSWIYPRVVSEHLRTGSRSAEVNRLAPKIRALGYALQARLSVWE